MRLMQFVKDGKRQFGAELKDGEHVLNLSDVADNTIDFLRLTENNAELYREVQQRVENANVDSGNINIINKSDIEKFLAPVLNPDKLLCSGMNYRDHCEEQNVPIPKEPIVFNKFPSCIVGPTDPILYPKYDDITQEMDWEVEMTLVIGKTGKYIKVIVLVRVKIRLGLLSA
jgi:2-keto-4-pentenoate hydratase/2-oxohepta-3-ene-1,7-dioic acid hydratase in catechol pathway